MTQKQKTLALLAALAATAGALGSYAWYGVYKKGAVEKTEKDRADTLFTFTKDEVKQVAVTAKGETTTIARDGKDAWTITSPIKTPAEKLSVDSLVDKVAGLKRKRVVTGPTDAKEYGLQSPRIKIVLTLSSGKTFELDVGDDNPYDGTLFAKRGGDADVEVCEGGLKYPLEKGLFDLRDKRVFDFDETALHRLEVVTPSLAYGLAKAADGSWTIVAPVEATADAAKANQIAAALRNLRATRFTTEQASADDLKRFGLDHPGYTVQVSLAKDLAPKTLALAEIKEAGTAHVYAKQGAEPWIAEVPSTLLKDLGQTVMDLRDKTVLSFKAAEVTGLRFQTPNGTFEAKRERAQADGGATADNWSLVAPKAEPAKRWKLSSLLSALETLKGSSIISESATKAELDGDGLSRPTKTVQIIGAKGAVLAELLVGKVDNANAYIKAGSSPQIYEVESYRLTQIPNDAVDLAETPPAAKDGGTARKPTVGH